MVLTFESRPRNIIMEFLKKSNRFHISNMELVRIALITFLILQFLFFIDEGFYNFQWMNSWMNWIVFSIYFSILLGIQVLMYLCAQLFGMKRNLMMISTLGIGLGLILLFSAFG